MFQTKKIYSLLFLAVVFLFAAQDVFACSCGQRPTVLDEFEDSKLVVVVKVVSLERIEKSIEKPDEEDEEDEAVDEVKKDSGEEVKEDEDDFQRYKSARMVVEKVYKGNVKVGDELTFGQGGGADCIWTFDERNVGREYLFYLNAPSKEHPMFDEEEDEPTKDAVPMYYAEGCGRSTSLDGATDDLLYLDKMNKLRGKTRISGYLNTYTEGAPSCANVKIKIIGKSKVYETKTDKDRFYEIYDLPAGEYLIEPQMPKGWKINGSAMEHSPSYPYPYGEKRLESKTQVPLVLKDKKHAELNFVFIVDNHIRGKVLSPVGKPMRGVGVNAISSETADGDYRGFSSYTNEKGEFEIQSLSPGNYILVINNDGKMSADEPFGTLFYPGVTDPKQAGVVSIDVGKFLNGVNIQIPKTEELIEINGRFLYSDGKPVAEEWIEFKGAGNSEKIETEKRGKSDAQGRFTIKLLKGSNGKLWGEMSTYVGAFEKCPELEKIIKKTGETHTTVKTDEIEIDGNSDLENVKLTFPFPSCTKAKD